MNYANLEKEISSYKILLTQDEQTLSKFSLFFKNISKQGVLFTDKIKTSLEEFYQEISKETRTTTHNISFSNFYHDFKTFLENSKQIFILIEKNIADKISEFIIENKSCIENINNKLYNILVKLSESKSKMEKYKHSYFDACKVAMDQEKKMKGKNNNKKYESISETQKQVYKEELNKFNNILDEKEEQYQTIFINYSEEYYKKINLLKDSMNKFKTYGKSIGEKYKEMIINLERFTNYINVDNDVEYFKQDRNYINENKRRFLKEDFLDYEIFKKNVEKNKVDGDLNNDNFKYDNSISMNNIILKYEITYDKSLKILNLGKINYDEKIEENEENKKINNYIKELIDNEKELEREKYVYLLSYLSSNEQNIITFVNLLLKNFYKGSKFVKIKNIQNILLYSNILNIIINCSFNNPNILYICFIGIFISEKTIYFSKENPSLKYYLCKIIPKKSNNTLFSSNNFWTQLIHVNIAMLADVLTKKEIEKREKKGLNKNEGMLNKMKNMFKKDTENQRIENEILYSQIYHEKLPNYCAKVLNQYLTHFTNFDFEHKKASEIIVDMSIQYKYDQSYVTYFLAELNSNICTNLNKKNSSYDGINNENLSKIFMEQNINNNKIDYERLYFKKLDKKISKHITDVKLRIIIHSIKYLDLEDLPILLSINKLYNKTLTKLIYKNLLIRYGKDLDIDKHILIWRILLNYTQTTVEYNYEEIKQKISVNPNKEQFRVIDLDVIRTNFISDNKLNQIKIGNILKSISYINPKLNYCQGMNYIAAFLLNITNKEEDAFYLFLSILLHTEYGKLFEKDLEKLKKYFYVFERIIYILLPELHTHFKECNIDASYFLSPWLITLFTDNFKNIKDSKNPKILLKIFDLFIFSGWKSIIRIGMSLLKIYESKLINLGQEELLKYLINGICKNVFFQNEFFDELINILENFKIGNYLVNSVENEYELRQLLPKIGGKNIFEITNI